MSEQRVSPYSDIRMRRAWYEGYDAAAPDPEAARLLLVIEGLVATRENQRAYGDPCYQRTEDMAIFAREAWVAAYDAIEHAALAASPEPAGGLDAAARALAFIVVRDRQVRDGIEREKRWTLATALWANLDEDQRNGWRDLAAEYARLQKQNEPAALREAGDAEVPE